MKSVNSFTAVLLTISLLSIPTGHAANKEHSSQRKIDAELKNAWSELDKLKSSEAITSAKIALKKALIESYTSQGKELKARWLKNAPLTEISNSIKLQHLHHKKDFPYPASLFYTWVQKQSDDSFKFKVRNSCIRTYLINKNSPEVYAICEKFLPNIKIDDELHPVPEDFPLEKVLKSEYRKKYLLPVKTYK